MQQPSDKAWRAAAGEIAQYRSYRTIGFTVTPAWPASAGAVSRAIKIGVMADPDAVEGQQPTPALFRSLGRAVRSLRPPTVQRLAIPAPLPLSIFFKPLLLGLCLLLPGAACALRLLDAGLRDGVLRQMTLLGRSRRGLVSCVQMGAIEFRGWDLLVPAPERPDRLVFDLDPNEALPFAQVAHAAEAVRDRLGELGLASFALLSGGKGVHVPMPLTLAAEWDAVRSFAERFARALAQAEPKRFVAVATEAKRTGRIFVDWLRNGRGSMAVRIEGYAIIGFDTASWGAIGNVAVLASEPTEQFGQAAWQAIVNGRVAPSDHGRRGCVQRVRFRLPFGQ